MRKSFKVMSERLFFNLYCFVFFKNEVTVFIRSFRENAVRAEIQWRAKTVVTLNSIKKCSLFQSLFVFRRSRVYNGDSQNEWVIKTILETSKSSKFVCIKSSLQFMHNSYPIVEIPRYLVIISLVDVCETSHSRSQKP